MTDALILHLNGLGYQPVLLPDPGIVPPDLYLHSEGAKGLVRLGSLGDFLHERLDPKPPETGQRPDIELVRTTAKSLKGAVSLLKGAFALFGAKAGPKLQGSYSNRAKLVFRVVGVTHKRVPWTWVHDVAQKLKVDALPPDSEGRLHVAYEYLYATRLSMHEIDAAAAVGKADAGQVADLFNLDGAISAKAENASTVSFGAQRAPPVAFAYKAGSLRHRGGKWIFSPEVSIGGGFMASPNEAGRAPYVPLPGTLAIVRRAAPVRRNQISSKD